MYYLHYSMYTIYFMVHCSILLCILQYDYSMLQYEYFSLSLFLTYYLFILPMYLCTYVPM
jgi:hypothetical protein